MLKLSTSGFYDWERRGPSRRDLDQAHLMNLIYDAHKASYGTYGARRVHAELVLGQHIRVSHGRVERLIRSTGLQGVHRTRLRMDCFSRRVVGWAMADHIRAELVVDALQMALWNRRPKPGAIHHSDHGSTYTSWAFGHRLREAGLLGSMGTIGDCFDCETVLGRQAA